VFIYYPYYSIKDRVLYVIPSIKKGVLNLTIIIKSSALAAILQKVAV